MTVAVIRDTMITAVLGIDPLLNSETRFRHHRENMPFGQFCEANPQASWRLFSIRDTGESEAADVTNTDSEWRWITIQCAIAYPLDFRAGPLGERDRDDLIASDARQIRATIGPGGYPTLEEGVAGCVTSCDWKREEGDACVFSLFTMRVGYYEAMP